MAPGRLTLETAGPAETPRRLPLYRTLAVAALAGVVATVLAWRGWEGHPDPENLPGPASAHPDEPDSPIRPEEQARIVAGLEALADRLEGFEIGPPGDLTGLMARISARVRYRGPTLSPSELARLRGESDPDRDRALAWHERLKTFADDRPLPDDFARLPLDRQLDRLARSFHLEPPPRAEDVPGALAEALAREGPVRPTPLAARYPALSDYARFLGRLPRVQ